VSKPFIAKLGLKPTRLRDAGCWILDAGLRKKHFFSAIAAIGYYGEVGVLSSIQKPASSICRYQEPALLTKNQ